MQTETYGSKNIRYTAVGSVKVNGEWAGYIRQPGMRQFAAFKDNGEMIGTFHTQSLALKAIAETV